MKYKRKIQANVMQGYDDKGKLVMYYWQKEPIKTTYGPFHLKISWKFRYNPIWRIKQWWWRRTLYKAGEKFK